MPRPCLHVDVQPGRRARVMDLPPGSGYSTSMWQRDTLAVGVVAPDGTLRLTLQLRPALVPRGLPPLALRVFISYGQTPTSAVDAPAASSALVVTPAP